MSNNLLNLFQLSGYFIVLFGVAEMLYRFAKVKTEYTRKLVHVGTGLLTMLFPIMFTHFVWVILICAVFFILLLLSLKYGFLPSINAIQRKSYGSLAYPVIVALTFVFYYFKSANSHPPQYFYFYLPMLTMALADPAAALLGKRFPFGKFSIGKDTKTVVGSLAFFAVAGIVSIVILPSINWTLAFLIAIVSTSTEAITGKGLDNFTIPLAICALLYFYPIL